MTNFNRIFHFLKTIFQKDNYHFETWQILTSIALTAGSIGFFFLRIASLDILSLHDFNDRTIGIVVFTATNASLRTGIYMGLWIYSFILFFVSLICLGYVSKKFMNTKSLQIERELLFYFSLFSVCSLCLYVLSQQKLFLSNFIILMMLLCLVGVIILLKHLAIQGKINKFSGLFLNGNILIVSFVIPYIFIFIYLIFFNPTFEFTDIHLIIYVLIWASFIVSYNIIGIFIERKRISKVFFDDAFQKALIPLLIIPLTIPISNECQYTLSKYVQILPVTLTKLFVIVLFLISIGIFLFKLLRKERDHLENESFNIHLIYFPIIVISTGLFHYYQHFLDMGTYDVFHHGELLIPAQQLFVFHKLPFIDIYPTHGFSDIFYQILFSLFNGYSPVQPIVWQWISAVFALGILYYIISRLTTPLFAFLFCLFLPSLTMINQTEPYIFCLVSVFTLIWVLKNPTFTRLCVHWLIILFLFLFRLDFGPAALIGTIFIFSVIMLKDRINKNSNHNLHLRVIALSGIITYGTAFILFCSAVNLSNQSIFKILLLNLQLITSQPLQAYSIFFYDISLEFILQYIIFPVIALTIIILFVFHLIVCDRDAQETQIILTFIAVMTLALSIRTVQRHSIMEGLNIILYPLLLILLPLNFKFKSEQLKYVAIIMLILLYTILVPSFSSISPEKNTKIFEYYHWTPDQSRIIDNTSSYQNVTYFFGNTLRPFETFYDFSNAPLIYIFSNREFIQYLIPNLYQTSEIIQYDTIHRLDSLYQKKSIPLILFKQGNRWDRVDYVPNEMRSYRITEYIYTHYKPAGYIDDRFQIWIANNRDDYSAINFEKQQGYSPIKSFSQSFDLQKLPYIWASYDPLNAMSNSPVIREAVNTTVKLEKEKEYHFSVDPHFDKSTGNYLYVKLKGDHAAHITLKYGYNSSDSFTFITVPSSEGENYLIRTSSQWKWMNSTIDILSIKSDKNIDLIEMNIRKGD